ncbi:glycosyltransferase family 4 protein [Sphingomonas endophytica]|uniref:Glycosyl transferase family 1 n=1 Tax=Sphingomonas endophytica TaxID=869719 RepID=A0A147HYG3_9SPHN|nr:glycosyltransferase family 4 protein [Sphingomonas endophytica]KTT69996.1 hypothetical protein NS334_13355 [Sphingomonas endophytica]
MSQPLSILHVLPRFAPEDADGWSRRVVRLIDAFAARARHTIAAEEHDPLPAGVRATIAQDPPPLAGGVSVARYERIARAMRGHDLVLSYGAGAIDAVMARRAFARDTPPIIHHEDPCAGEPLGARLYRRIALPAAAGLVVTGDAAARIAVTRWKVPVAHVQVIPDGVELSGQGGGPDPKLIASFRRTARETVIGIVADLSGRDNVALLVRAVAGLAGRFRLVVVGDGPARADIERAALAMGIDDRLVLPGAVAPPSRYLGGFDLLLLPMTLGAPPIVVEAMAAGLPVVALDGSAAAAMLSPDNHACLAAHAGEVQVRDAIQVLAVDAALRARIGAANRYRAAAGHDAATMIERSARLYADAAGRPGSLG